MDTGIPQSWTTNKSKSRHGNFACAACKPSNNTPILHTYKTPSNAAEQPRQRRPACLHPRAYRPGAAGPAGTRARTRPAASIQHSTFTKQNHKANPSGLQAVGGTHSQAFKTSTVPKVSKAQHNVPQISKGPSKQPPLSTDVTAQTQYNAHATSPQGDNKVHKVICKHYSAHCCNQPRQCQSLLPTAAKRPCNLQGAEVVACLQCDNQPGWAGSTPLPT